MVMLKNGMELANATDKALGLLLLENSWDRWREELEESEKGKKGEKQDDDEEEGEDGSVSTATKKSKYTDKYAMWDGKMQAFRDTMSCFTIVEDRRQ